MNPSNEHGPPSDFINKPIRVVPDANILFADPFLRSVAAQTIIAVAQFMDIKLVVSEVTLEEVRNIVKEQIEAFTKELKHITKKAKALNMETGVNVYNLGYESKTALETSEKLWATLKMASPLLPYPKTGLEELVKRSINECRPFLKGDKGLRDCLLWFSILAAMQTDRCNYLLVSNDDGFYDGKSVQLHPDLDKDLVSNKCSGRVLARKSLADVVEDFIKPYLKADQAVKVAIESGGIRDFTDEDDKVAILITEYLIEIDIPDEWIKSSNYYSASFDVAEDVTMTDLISVLELDNKVLTTSEWEASVAIEVSCPGYQDESETVIISFKIESLVDPNTLEVESHEVTEYELKGWYDSETKEMIPY